MATDIRSFIIGGNSWPCDVPSRSLSSIRVAVAVFFVEVLAEVARTLDVAVGRVQLHAAELLQVGRLRVDEELVEVADLAGRESAPG